MTDLKKYLPALQSPLIINGPMAGFAGGALASAVTLAGGLGLIGSAFSMSELRTQLELAAENLRSENTNSSDLLPVGVGFLAFIAKIEEALPLIQEFKPVVAWLFAAKEITDYVEWARRIREVSPKTQIWIQTGSVGAALELARTVKPDVLVMQGADAGGHGFQHSASIISLVPETNDTLEKEGFGHIPLLASGGIVDGRGVAAALALGAKGVVMGTRFLSSEEVMVNPEYRAAVLEAKDGGQATIRSKVFDELRGPNIWPEEYDGRSIVVKSYTDWTGGMEIDEIRRLHNEEASGENKGYAVGRKGRAAIWAGTGIGLVKEVQSAKSIVEGVREDARSILKRFEQV